MVFPTLETERLILRELTLEDREEVFQHFADEDVTRFMDIEPCRDLQEAEEIIRFHLEDTGTRWGLFDRADGKLIGTCGYHVWVKGEEDRAEIGFDLTPSSWGRGLMREALQPVIEFGFDGMGLDLIEATVEPGNERSVGLLERLGFRREAELRDNLIYYSLRR